MKIAVYHAYDRDDLYEADDWREGSENYVRLTEIVEVELPRLPPALVVPAQLQQLAVAETELRNKFNEKLSEIQTKRQNLLALTQEVQS